MPGIRKLPEQRGMGEMREQAMLNAVRFGEVEFDVTLRLFYNREFQFLYDDAPPQAVFARWQREGRIVVEGETVRMRVR